MTPAVTAAKRARMAHTIHRYDHDAAAPSYGLEAAEKLGLEPERVFKTLIASVTGSGGESLVFALVPVAGSLDLKKLAAAAGGKKAEMADAAAAERATGYQVGGISPLGQKKRLRTVIDETASRFPTVYFSAGRRGLQLEMAPADLVKLTQATVAAIAGE